MKLRYKRFSVTGKKMNKKGKNTVAVQLQRWSVAASKANIPLPFLAYTNKLSLLKWSKTARH
jgi:hypothetical protein